MKIGSDFYPYPVLTDYGDDYVDSSFEVDYSIKTKAFETKILDVKVSLVNRELEELVEEGIAGIYLHLECPQTSYRKAIRLEDYTYEIAIDRDHMIKQLEVNCILVLDEDFYAYSNTSFNKLYYDEDYFVRNLTKGSILATTLTQIIDIPYEGENLENISSIIRVGQSEEDFMNVEMSDNTILVKIPKKQYELYFRYSNTIYQDLIMTSTILPALIYVIEKMPNFEDRELNWFKVINSKFESKNIDIASGNTGYTSLELAQMLLEDPLERAFENLDRNVEG